MAEALAYFHKVLMRPQQDAQRIVVQKTRFFGKVRAALEQANTSSNGSKR